MQENEIVETLNDLISYIEDEWDCTDNNIAKEAQENIKALNEAIQIIQSKKVIGSLNLKDKTYTIIE